MKHAVHSICAALLLGAAPLHAAQQYVQGAGMQQRTRQAQAEPAPAEILNRELDRLGGFLSGGGFTPKQLRAFLEREVGPQFDFEAMARWAAGPLYYRLSPEQQDALTQRLSELFLNALARNLGSYAQPLPRIDVYPSRVPPWAEQATVRALVRPRNAYPIQLDFRFYRTPVGWRIFDVSANGISAVAYYRNYFGDLLRRYGPDALLQ